VSYVDEHDASLRSPRIYAAVLGVTIATILLSLWNGVALDGSAFVILMVAVALTGIPHGAVDHLVAARLYGLSDSWRDQGIFYGSYLLLMALYGALWFVAPVWCLAAFLLMTMYHFGQADLAYWSLPPGRARLAYLSRGTLLMGLPIAAFPELVAPIFEAIAGIQMMQWPLLTEHAATVQAIVAGQHAAVLGVLALAPGTALPNGAWREAVNVVVLAALFYVVHPLVAFAVYFGLWHSLGHILELLRFFRREGTSTTSLTGFYRKAALFTGISFLGLAGLYAATQSFGLQDQMIALLFILISVMTLPHMIVVERLYDEHDAQRASAAA
jgi:Brp/Blh family beta-carotene 15,15'-monooxygenase